MNTITSSLSNIKKKLDNLFSMIGWVHSVKLVSNQNKTITIQSYRDKIYLCLNVL